MPVVIWRGQPFEICEPFPHCPKPPHPIFYPPCDYGPRRRDRDRRERYWPINIWFDGNEPPGIPNIQEFAYLRSSVKIGERRTFCNYAPCEQPATYILLPECCDVWINDLCEVPANSGRIYKVMETHDAVDDKEPYRVALVIPMYRYGYAPGYSPDYAPSDYSPCGYYSPGAWVPPWGAGPGSGPGGGGGPGGGPTYGDHYVLSVRAWGAGGGGDGNGYGGGGGASNQRNINVTSGNTYRVIVGAGGGMNTGGGSSEFDGDPGSSVSADGGNSSQHSQPNLGGVTDGGPLSYSGGTGNPTNENNPTFYAGGGGGSGGTGANGNDAVGDVGGAAVTGGGAGGTAHCSGYGQRRLSGRGGGASGLAGGYAYGVGGDFASRHNVAGCEHSCVRHTRYIRMVGTLNK